MTSLSSSLSSVEFVLMRSRLPPSGSKHGDKRVINVIEESLGPRSAFVRVGSTVDCKHNIAKPLPTFYSSRRMSAMLKSPAVRKHIAESLGLDPSASDVGDLIQRRLSEGKARVDFPKVTDTITESSGTMSSTSPTESRDRKRYRSVDDGTCRESGGHLAAEQLLRLLTVGASPPSTSRDHDEVIVRRRRSSLDSTGNCPPPFRLPTYQEFVRARRSKSRDTIMIHDYTNTDDVTNTCVAERRECRKGVLSSFGGSYNDLRIRRLGLDDKWLSPTKQPRSSVERRDHANRKLEIDSNGIATIFIKHHQCPLVVDSVTNCRSDTGANQLSSIEDKSSMLRDVTISNSEGPNASAGRKERVIYQPLLSGTVNK